MKKKKQALLIISVVAISICFSAIWFVKKNPTIISLARLVMSGYEHESGLDALKKATTEVERFYHLGDAAKELFNDGDVVVAEQYAKELLDLAPNYRNNWNYGNAVHDGHVVLGRIALTKGEVEKAKEHLFSAAETPGSPQLNSFGPNLSLAHDLLNAGESEVVIEYLELVISFWANEAETSNVHARNLEKTRYWQHQIQNGETPDFGANMVY